MTSPVTEQRAQIEPTPPPAGRGVAATLVATCMAFVGVVVAQAALGADDPLVVGIAAYAVFVITLMVAKRATRGRTKASTAVPLRPPPRGPAVPDPTSDGRHDVIDLTESEPVVSRAVPGPERTDLAPDGERPLRRRTVGAADLGDAAFALLGAVALVAIQRAVTGSPSALGTAILLYVAFLAVFAVLVRCRADVEAAIDRIMILLFWSAAVVVVAVVVWMMVFLLQKGLPGLTAGFFTEDLSKVGPLNPGGGAMHAIIGTIQQVGIATIIVVPIAVLTAVYLNELRGRMAGPIRFVVDAMSGLPSIVAGLLVFTVWVNGRGFSGLAASFALGGADASDRHPDVRGDPAHHPRLAP